MSDVALASGLDRVGTLTKAQIRSRVLSVRNALPLHDQKQRSDQIMDKIVSMKTYRLSKVVMGYSNFGSEINTRPFLEHVLDQGKTLVLPKINRACNTLSLYAVDDPGGQLLEGMWGIHEPCSSLCEEVQPHMLDFVLIPGLAFDAHGGRLGYGRGYYDKLLSSCLSTANRPWLVAGAFDFQLVDRVPTEAHDVPIHAVVTESGCFASRIDAAFGPTT